MRGHVPPGVIQHFERLVGEVDRVAPVPTNTWSVQARPSSPRPRQLAPGPRPRWPASARWRRRCGCRRTGGTTRRVAHPAVSRAGVESETRRVARVSRATNDSPYRRAGRLPRARGARFAMAIRAPLPIVLAVRTPKSTPAFSPPRPRHRSGRVLLLASTNVALVRVRHRDDGENGRPGRLPVGRPRPRSRPSVSTG